MECRAVLGSDTLGTALVCCAALGSDSLDTALAWRVALECRAVLGVAALSRR